MKTLTFDVPHTLPSLHAELLDAVPQWFVLQNQAGQREAIATVEGDGTTVRLTVPDDADEAAITAIVNAHDPAAAQAVKDVEETQRTTLRQQIVAQAQSAVGVALADLTPAQRNALIVGLLHRAGGITNDLKIRPLADWMR